MKTSKLFFSEAEENFKVDWKNCNKPMNQRQIFPEEKFTTHGYSLWLVRSETVQKICNKFSPWLFEGKQIKAKTLQPVQCRWAGLAVLSCRKLKKRKVKIKFLAYFCILLIKRTWKTLSEWFFEVFQYSRNTPCSNN